MRPFHNGTPVYQRGTLVHFVIDLARPKGINTVGMPEYAKDVMLAVIGAGVGLAGLLLVFSGYVFAEANSFPAETDDNIIKSFKKAGEFALWPFLASLANAILAVMWIIHPSKGLYSVTIVAFLLLLLFTAIYGAIVLRRYL